MAAPRILALVMLGGIGAAVWAQNPVAPKLKDCDLGQDSTEANPCRPVSAAERFKFPGPDSGSTPAVSGNASPAPDAPAPSAPQPQGSAAGRKFPFPTDDSSSSTAGESSSSSSNAGGDVPLPDDPDAQPDTPKLADKGSSGSTGKRGKAVKIQTPEQRVDEDLEVGNFYRNDNNFQGAYLRAKDAFALMPEDADVNLLYAEVAQKLGKKDEALEHFQAYLKIDPKGKKATEAKEALEKLSGPTK